MHELRTAGGRAIVYAVAISLAVISCSPAREPAKVIIVAPLTAWTWPMYIAKEAGYYDAYGLEVDLVFANHPAGAAMLVSGEADVNVLPLQRAMEIASKEDSFVALGSPLGKWLFALIGRSEVPSVPGLRGRRLGVAQIGDATYNYALALLARFGLTVRDVQLVVTGADGRIPALVSGRVDATMLSAPAYFRLERSGYRSLANIADYDDIHTPNVLLFKRSTVEKRRDLPELLVKAHAEAVKRFYDDREFSIRAHLVYDKQDVKDLGRVYDTYRRTNALERVPYVLADAIKFVIETSGDSMVSARLKAHDYSSLIDNTTVAHLVDHRFFEQLFGPQIKSEQNVKSTQAFWPGISELGESANRR